MRRNACQTILAAPLLDRWRTQTSISLRLFRCLGRMARCSSSLCWIAASSPSQASRILRQRSRLSGNPQHCMPSSRHTSSINSSSSSSSWQWLPLGLTWGQQLPQPILLALAAWQPHRRSCCWPRATSGLRLQRSTLSRRSSRPRHRTHRSRGSCCPGTRPLVSASNKHTPW